MKFEILRSDFSQIIGKIQSVVPAKPSIPILANVLFEVSGDQLTLSATDLTVSVRMQCKVKVEREGAITLPGRRVFQLVRELTTPEITIEAESPEVAIITSGASRFQVQGLHKSEFPSFPDISDGTRSTFKGGDLKAMFERTSFAAARDDTREVLNGVLLKRVEDLATFIATDGKRLASNELKLETAEGEASYILPLKAVDELVKLIDDDDEDVQLTILPGKVAVEAGSTQLIAKLLSGQYPDVSRVIPEKSEKQMPLHREELISLLRQVALFTSEENNSVKFTIDHGELSLSAANGKVGAGKVSMPVNYTGSKLEIAFNPHYFLDILRHSSDETVNLMVSDSYNPGLITDSSSAKFVIMPMRLEPTA